MTIRHKYYNPNYLCNYAAESGQTKLLEWALSQGYPCDDSITTDAILSGNLTCIEYVFNRGYKFIEYTPIFLSLVRYGEIEHVKWMYNKEHFIPTDALDVAAKYSRYSLVVWLHEHGAVYNVRSS